LPRLENADRFRPLLLVIARHTAVDARRGNARLRPEPLDAVDDLAAAEPGLQELAEMADLVGVVREAVTGLSRRDATAIAPVALGFGVADVAAALGIERGAAKVAVHRARQRLKVRLLMNVVARREAGGCAELDMLAATDLVAIARHMRTCDTCAQTARTVLI
jgi:DNA-directed RNA polymerase specialized sigma24 family protein